jgi:hypothetical protein
MACMACMALASFGLAPQSKRPYRNPTANKYKASKISIWTMTVFNALRGFFSRAARAGIPIIPIIIDIRISFDICRLRAGYAQPLFVGAHAGCAAARSAVAARVDRGRLPASEASDTGSITAGNAD